MRLRRYSLCRGEEERVRTVKSIQTSQGAGFGKLYAICLVKNEDDIIGQTLTYATQYCNKIFVIDNGSTDQTWDIVQDLGGLHPQIVPFAQKDEPYDEGLRWFAYDAHHQELTEDDWWLILDSDEFLAEDPRAVISQAMKERTDIIKSWQIQFYYTEKDYEAWMADRDNRDLPIFVRRRYYRIDWQEPRLFRNQLKRHVIFRQSKLLTDSALWGTAVERIQGRVSSRRIFNRHFQYRDPEQIEQRLRLRLKTLRGFRHVKTAGSADWRSVMRSSKNLSYYEAGQPWRFNISGLAHAYRGRLLYIILSRFLRARRWLTRVLAACSHKIS